MSLRRYLIAALAAALLLTPVVLGAGFAASSAQAAPLRQEGTDQRTITVTGYGFAYGVPDVVRVGLGVESVNTDIADAMNEVNERMDAVIDVLVEGGVEREDIRTEYFQISQDYSFSGPMPAEGDMAAAQQGRPYRVSTTVRVTVRNPEVVGDLLADAVNAGANLVNYIEFDIADRTALESEARASAVEDARARADELAGLLGLTVGEPLQVLEGPDVMPLTNRMFAGMGGGAADSASISQGTLSVSMSVTITFALQ